MIDLTKVTGLTSWPVTRKKLEEAFHSVLQIPEHAPIDLQVRILEENDIRSFTRRLILFSLSEIEMITGWLFLPEGRDDVPAILCCHHESPFGKDEAAGIEGNPWLAFAQHYAEIGYATLAIDMPTVGKRMLNKSEPYNTVSFYKEFKNISFAAKTLSDHRRALDVLSETKRVDPARIGVIGHGLGGMNALLLAACDNRIQACVASCGFTRFATDKKPGMWPKLSHCTLIPQIKKAAATKSLPFDWEHIIALAAPTPVQIITSLSNALHDNPKSCVKAVNAAEKVYKLLGAPGALDHFTHHDGYTVVPETIEVADEWFERWL